MTLLPTSFFKSRHRLKILIKLILGLTFKAVLNSKTIVQVQKKCLKGNACEIQGRTRRCNWGRKLYNATVGY